MNLIKKLLNKNTSVPSGQDGQAVLRGCASVPHVLRGRNIPPQGRDRNTPDLLRGGTTTLLDQLAPASFYEDYSCFQMEEAWGRVWFVYDLPPHFPVHKIYSFHGDVWMSQFVYPLNPAEIAPALRQKRTMLHGENLFDAKRGGLTSYGRQATLSATEEALARIEIGDETIYMLGWYLAVFAPDRPALEGTSTRFEDTLREAGVQFYRACARQLDGVNSLLPLGADRLGNARNMTADALGQMFPFLRKTHFDPDGLPYGVHRHNGAWVTLDPFDPQLPNGSSFILGQSGMGKSVYLKHLMEWAVLMGHRVFAVDLENEFRALTEELGGVYFDLKRGSEHKMNILDLNPETEDPIDEGLSVLTGFLQVLSGGQLDKMETGVIIPNAYLETLAAAGISPDDPETWGKEPPLLPDLLNVLVTMPQAGAQDLAALLNQYGQGLYAEDFAQPTNVDTGRARLVVFGLADVRDTMLPVRLWQIQSYIWSRVLDRKRAPTHVIIDESWHLLKFPGMAAQLAAMARRFRKHFGALHLATHKVEDLSRSAEAEIIRDTAGTVLLFGQSTTAAERLGHIFGLNAMEIQNLPRLGKGDAILIRKIAGAGDVHIPIYIPLPPHRQALYTTDPREWNG